MVPASRCKIIIDYFKKKLLDSLPKKKIEKNFSSLQNDSIVATYYVKY